MDKLVALTLFISVALAGQAPQAPDTSSDPGMAPGEFLIYSSSIGHKLTVKWGGTLMSEMNVPYGVMLEIKGSEESNPELPKSFPWVLRGKLRIRLKAEQGETGPASEIMKTAPWELNLDDAEIRVEPTGRVTQMAPR